MNKADFGASVVPTTLPITNKASFETAKTAIEANVGNYILTITGTVDVEDNGIELAKDTNVSLRGGGTINKSSGVRTILFNLSNSGSKLILRDATLKGHAGSDVSLVTVSNSAAEFVMVGGTITGGSSSSVGGGVNVANGVFTMSGGTISGNSAPAGGGVLIYAAAGATFAKTGGTIYGDTDTNHGDDATENTATGAANQGHAVLVVGSGGSKYRDTTAGSAVNLDSGTSDNWGQ